jgi:hypothetical protein
MNDLEKLQNEILEDLVTSNIPAKITEAYPAHFGIQAGFLAPLYDQIESTLYLGGVLQHFSTGGRIHFQDYSGEIRVDQLSAATSIGVVLNYQSKQSEIFDIGFGLSLNYVFSGFSSSFLMKIGDETESETLDFSSSSIAIEPSIIPSLKIWEFRLGLSLSYFINFPGTLESDDIPDAFLINRSGDEVTINWSGFRSGILVSLTL